MRRRVLLGISVLVALVVVAALVVVGKAVWDRAHRTDLQRALGLVPLASKRVSFTDWALVRQQLHVSDSAAGPGLASWLQRAYSQDLSAASSIDDEAAVLQRKYGFSPANAQWEAYAQSDQGATMVLRVDDSVSFKGLAANLSRLGYHKPSSADGVWNGGVDLVARISSTLNPEVQYVALLASQHLVVTSDTASYAATAAKVARGDGTSLASVSTVADVAGRVAEPAAGVLWARDFACADLAMSSADAGSQQQAAQLIAQAGKTTPLSGLLMAMSPQRVLTVAEEFDSSGQADENLKARARLAVGDAVGRGEGTFADDYRLTQARTSGPAVLLTMRPRTADTFVLSGLDNGPVIFATC